MLSSIRCTLVMLVCAVVTTACVTPAVIPPESTIGRLRTIAVVPIETQPLLLHPATEEERAAILAVGLIPPGMKGGGLGYAPVPPILCRLCPALQPSIALAQSSTPREGETIIVTQDPASPWMSTVGLAHLAVEELRRSGGREVILISGYGRLPVEDRSVNVVAENWMAPLRRWYNAPETTLDFGAQGPPRAEAILEIGVANYEYGFGILEGRLLMQVIVKLSDPATKKVVGKTRCFEAPKGKPLPEMLVNQGEPMRMLIESTGSKLLLQCLREVGLTGRWD